MAGATSVKRIGGLGCVSKIKTSLACLLILGIVVRRLIIDVDFVLGLLRRMDVGDVANVSEVHTTSIFSVDPEDGGSMYFRNVGNIAHIHTL
jgi:hypothetical protein